MEVDKDKKAIKLDFAIPQGGQLQFTMPPDFDIVKIILNNATVVKKDQNAGADALLVFSCAGRINALGPLVTSENEGLHELWNVPMAGFFSYGEYGRALDRNQEFHSGACCWVVLKEKQS